MRKHDSKRGFHLLVIVLIFLAVVQIAASNRLIGLDNHLENVRSEINYLERENQLLQQKIASSSALVNLEKQASEIGFIQATLIFIPPDYPLALGSEKLLIEK